MLRPLYPREKKPCTHCTGSRMGPRTGQDGCGKSRLHHRDSTPGPSQPVASRCTNYAIPASKALSLKMTTHTPSTVPPALDIIPDAACVCRGKLQPALQEERSATVSPTSALNCDNRCSEQKPTHRSGTHNAQLKHTLA
jgi:hypothetical protein